MLPEGVIQAAARDSNTEQKAAVDRGTNVWHRDSKVMGSAWDYPLLPLVSAQNLRETRVWFSTWQMGPLIGYMCLYKLSNDLPRTPKLVISMLHTDMISAYSFLSVISL